MKDFLKAVKKNANKEFGKEEFRRADICGQCDEKEKRVYSEIVNAIMKELKGYACTRCDCPISTKVFATQEKNICDKWKQ
jgi:hypothetical protein